MAMYKCPTLGDCERANTGELFDRGPGEDLHCPDCKTPLDLQVPANVTGGKTKPAILAGIVGAVVLVIGGGSAFYYKHAHRADAQASAVSAQHMAATGAPASPGAALTPAAATPPSASIPAAIAGGIAPSSEAIAADRQAGDQKLTSGDPAGAATASNQAAAKEMIKVAIADMAQGKLDDAEKQLDDAKARDPKQSLVYYNLGVLRLKQSRTDDALTQFEASFLNGFQYFDAMAQDPDLDGIRQDPRFVALVKKYRSSAT
ncbi:tetratricopeptide repeat protein [Paraburkholderia kirstenboschensis]|uniref:Tetratricopeptide repeat protein n=1 Tax=Paraburkholderia kirstenboschensis TaxID=1245436 RepID=A0ABZ0EP67_9BURK|nr:hypothetical protein [Paraburkholderia kirstenboschensis]WOD18957.1 hypothetical protein RW095_40500 [Paraburkholderia kirstenboschensis]